jgi:hypothetical protein
LSLTAASKPNHPGAGVPPPEAPSASESGRRPVLSVLLSPCCWSWRPGAFCCVPSRRRRGCTATPGASAGGGAAGLGPAPGRRRERPARGPHLMPVQKFITARVSLFVVPLLRTRHRGPDSTIASKSVHPYDRPMAESAEHQFLSQCVTDTLSRLSRTSLYAYLEADRRKFDFACELLRDWSRPSCRPNSVEPYRRD